MPVRPRALEVKCGMYNMSSGKSFDCDKGTDRGDVVGEYDEYKSADSC